MHWVLNAYWDPLDFELPRIDGTGEIPWRRWIDTSLESPDDITDWREPGSAPGFIYQAGPRSVAVLVANMKNRDLPS